LNIETWKLIEYWMLIVDYLLCPPQLRIYKLFNLSIQNRLRIGSFKIGPVVFD